MCCAKKSFAALYPPQPDIRVYIPQDPERVKIIDRLASYVAKEGEQFEVLANVLPANQMPFLNYHFFSLQKLIIERERENPKFQFLYQMDSLESVYYRWRVFSLMHGDTLDMWRMEPFQIFAGGPFWIPPPVPGTEVC